VVALIVTIVIARSGKTTIVHAPEPVVVRASAPAVDAALAEADATGVVVDPAVAAPAAAEPVAGLAPDAAVTPSAEPVPRSDDPRPPPRARPRPKEPRDILAECTTTGAPNALACTIAACHVRDVAKARKWLANVPTGRRARAIEACDAVHVELEPPPKPRSAEPDCQADPMACQH
jgi:hypothetical protein